MDTLWRTMNQTADNPEVQLPLTPRPVTYDIPEFIPPDVFVSSEARRIVEIVLDLTISFVISFIGIFTNSLIIAVFTKQGFKDSVGVSMTTIALWDLVKCLSGSIQRMTGPISLWSEAKSVTWSNISVVVFNYLVSFSCYVTSVLAAYVAVERCLCVTMPLKIKWLLTPTVSGIVCVSISIIVFGWFLVVFGNYDIIWVFHPTYNETIAIYTSSRFSVNNTVLFEYYNLSGVLWPLLSLCVISVCTCIISHQLRQSTAFRNKKNNDYYPSANLKKSVARLDQNLNRVDQRLQFHHHVQETKSRSTKMSRRDQQVIKMLFVIIVIYIVSLTPREVIYLAKYFSEDFYFLKKYHNIFMTVVYVELFFDYLNGAVNLFVFLVMSSSFRATYFALFPWCLKTERSKGDTSLRH